MRRSAVEPSVPVESDRQAARPLPLGVREADDSEPPPDRQAAAQPRWTEQFEPRDTGEDVFAAPPLPRRAACDAEAGRTSEPAEPLRSPGIHQAEPAGSKLLFHLALPLQAARAGLGVTECAAE